MIARCDGRRDKRWAAALDMIVIVERPKPAAAAHQHLCMGYDHKAAKEMIIERNYALYIRRIGEKKLDKTGEKRARRVAG